MSMIVARQTADTTVSNTGSVILQVLSAVKDKIVSLAQIVFSFAKDTVWPILQNVAVQTWTFLRTPAGLITSGGTLGLGLAYLASGIKADEQPWLKAALNILAVASFVGMGIAIGLGITNGFTAVAF